MTKPKVLVLNGNPLDGTSFYRSSGVFPYIDTAEFIYSTNVDWATMMQCQVVFIPRPYTQNLVGVCEYVKTCKKALWLDLDDSHFDVPEHNPSYKELGTEVAIACHIACINMADVITVTTDYLKKRVLDHCPNANVIVISNAANNYLFDLTPSNHVRNKTILIRGGGSHTQDIEVYKDGLIQIMNDYPEYKWAFCGYWPRWAIDTLPPERLLLFQYSDLMKYFETLMELKPEIMIVPLENNEFNKSKSNIAWIEGTLAGAVVFAPDFLPEFSKYAGPIRYGNSSTLKMWFDYYQRNEFDDKEVNYDFSLEHIDKLSRTNEIRKDIIEQLSTKNEKFLIPKTENKVATDKEFFDHCLTHGHLQENETYIHIHSQALGQLHALLDFNTVVEFGCGPGYTLELLNDGGIQAFGMELNPYFINYFRNRNPHLADNIAWCDFIKDPIELDEPADLGISIEVFEHIDMPEEDWNAFIEKLSKQFKYFYFSSTPFRDKPSWDLYWGHVNIRPTSNWVSLFERNGWELIYVPKLLLGWDILFKSKNV